MRSAHQKNELARQKNIRENIIKTLLSFITLLFLTIACTSVGPTLNFAGREWKIKPTSSGKPPGNNNWSDQNAWVDSLGQLHLKISYSEIEDKWYCSEVISVDSFSFGTYQWYVIGKIDSFDKNVVLGLFQYAGPDGQNEIDIEMARFKDQTSEAGNFVVYPSRKGIKLNSDNFVVKLSGTYITQRYKWNSDSVIFQTMGGHRNDNQNEIRKWEFIPSNTSKNIRTDFIPQSQMPVYMNLWLISGKPPSDGKEVEVILKDFKYFSKE